MCNYFFIWAVCVLLIWHLCFYISRGEKNEETITPTWNIRFNFAASVDASLSEVLGEEGHARAHSTFFLRDPSLEWPSNTITRVNVCTPTSLALVRASFRATTNNDRGEREEDGERGRNTRGGIGIESVREIEEGGRREDLASPVPAAAPGRQAMNYRNEISDKCQAFPKSSENGCTPLENTVIREGEPGVCQAP